MGQLLIHGGDLTAEAAVYQDSRGLPLFLIFGDQALLPSPPVDLRGHNVKEDEPKRLKRP
jgi:hypothetical protein